MKTWQLEIGVVTSVLVSVLIFTGAPWIEFLGTLAVLASFAHGQVSSRLAEKEAANPFPVVLCHKWSERYFVAKEILWVSYFCYKGAWSALVGCAMFMLYPLWRAWYRSNYGGR